MEPNKTMHLIIFYRDVKRGFGIPGTHLCTRHFVSKKWQAVKSLNASMIIRIMTSYLWKFTS